LKPEAEVPSEAYVHMQHITWRPIPHTHYIGWQVLCPATQHNGARNTTTVRQNSH